MCCKAASAKKECVEAKAKARYTFCSYLTNIKSKHMTKALVKPASNRGKAVIPKKNLKLDLW